MRILIDTNVYLDVAFKRPKLQQQSDAALRRCEREGVQSFVAWHTLSNVFYLLAKDRGPAQAETFIRALLSVMQVATVGHSDALRAIQSALPDFEDALQLSAAYACGADYLLTRNTRDFGSPPKIAIVTPEDFLALTSR